MSRPSTGLVVQLNWNVKDFFSLLFKAPIIWVQLWLLQLNSHDAIPFADCRGRVPNDTIVSWILAEWSVSMANRTLPFYSLNYSLTWVIPLSTFFFFNWKRFCELQTRQIAHFFWTWMKYLSLHLSITQSSVKSGFKCIIAWSTLAQWLAISG